MSGVRALPSVIVNDLGGTQRYLQHDISIPDGQWDYLDDTEN